MSRFLRSQYIIDVKDVITVLIVVPVVFDSLAGLGKDSTWIAGGLVIEASIA